MWDYSQPEFYHFSEDSVNLAKFVSRNYESKHLIHVADFFAGSGVVGLELIKRMSNIKDITFVEGQAEFIGHLNSNIAHFNLDISFKTINAWVSSLSCENLFDLVVANPPYFDSNKGRRSESKNRQICRSFEIDSKEIFIAQLQKSLKKEGEAYFLARNLEDYSFERKVQCVADFGGYIICSYRKS